MHRSLTVPLCSNLSTYFKADKIYFNFPLSEQTPKNNIMNDDTYDTHFAIITNNAILLLHVAVVVVVVVVVFFS